MPDGGYIVVEFKTSDVDLREPLLPKSIRETNQIFKEIRREVLAHKLIDRVILRKVSKKMFNKRRPEWLSDYEMAQLITACIEMREKKEEQCKTTPNSLSV